MGWNGASGDGQRVRRVEQHWWGWPEGARRSNDASRVARGSWRQRVQEGVRGGGTAPVGTARGPRSDRERGRECRGWNSAGTWRYTPRGGACQRVLGERGRASQQACRG